ncbi:DUF6338 family protein [Enterococcus sp. CWB-B31]|uniref:DUF6338 family protein n=1 Tax=Enterococcus sp. CWB-B31 TaxID=2885159 RepID=UPI001E5837A7|nr:DUF6338 family protein [Enterococcus sp. CWB-B31]MCB5956366.1 DUF6338 family protein [Enterococcus sp. CWB-B31]
MVVTSEEVFFLTISYLIPGFLINTLIENSLYLKRNTLSTALLNYFIFSLLNITLFTSVDKIFYIIFGQYLINNIILISFFRSLMMPLFIWALIMWAYKSSYGKRLVNAMGLSKEHLTETSWDYIFYNITQVGGAYLIITLRDYTNIYGFVGDQSFISSNKEGSNDIYIENVFTSNEFNESINSGMLIYEKDILTIYCCHSEEGEL